MKDSPRWFLIFGVVMFSYLGSLKADATNMVPISLIIIVGLCIFGYGFEVMAYINGVKYGRANLLKISDLKEGEIYKIIFIGVLPEGGGFMVQLYTIEYLDIANPDHYSVSVKGILKLRSGNPELQSTEVDRDLKAGDLATLRRHPGGAASGLYLTKWLDQKTLSVIS